MSDLKQQCEGIIIAICTSDDRRATNACVKNWKLEGHIDVSNYYVYKCLKVFLSVANQNILLSSFIESSHSFNKQ